MKVVCVRTTIADGALVVDGRLAFLFLSPRPAWLSQPVPCVALLFWGRVWWCMRVVVERCEGA